MPTTIPTPRPKLGPASVPTGPDLPLQTLASAWLAGLILLAAVAGAAGEHGPRAAPAAAPEATGQWAAIGPRGDAGAAVLDMLSHD